MSYAEMYTILFNDITKAIEEIEKSQILTPEITRGIVILKEAQQKVEELFIEEEKTDE